MANMSLNEKEMEMAYCQETGPRGEPCSRDFGHFMPHKWVLLQRMGVQFNPGYPRISFVLESELSALETEVARWRALLERIVPDVRRWVENLDYEDEAEAWLADYDQLVKGESSLAVRQEERE